jgi:hypothetical protein
MNNTVEALDRITLNDILNYQALRALRFLHSGSVGAIAEQLLFVIISKTPRARSDTALTVDERTEFYQAWCRAINRLSRELTQRFLNEDGSVSWQRLLQGDTG